jgi:hypothetical protein
MTPEERAKEFADRVLWAFTPILRDNASIEIQGILREAIREAYEDAAKIVQEIDGWADTDKLAAAIRARMLGEAT